MALFGVIPPATPGGQHARDNAVIPAGAIKRDKQPNPLSKLLKKLSLRERAMLGVLIILAIAAVLVFLVVLPAVDKINGLEAEIGTLQEEKANIHVEPDHTPEYQALLEGAAQDYENYQRFYYPFMDPETIDKTVTNMLLSNDLYPVRLTMSAADPASMPLYFASASPLPKPVPTTDELADEDEAEDGANANDGDAGTDAGTEDSANENASDQQGRTEDAAMVAEAAASDSAIDGSGVDDSTGSLIYCYTIDLEAHGWMDDLFTFLEEARGITAMEIVSYSYTDPEEDTASSIESITTPSSTKPMGTSSETLKDLEGGTIVMQIKLYVYLGSILSTEPTAIS
jgi:hypothetical protein